MPTITQKTENPFSELWNLAKFICIQVDEAKSQNKLIKTSSTYVRTDVTHFEYQEKGNVGYGFSYSYFEKTEWHWRHQFQFLEDIIKKSEAFKSAYKALKSNFQDEYNHLEQALSTFSQHIATARADDNLSDQQIVGLITTISGDLNRSPMIIRLSAQIYGVWLECSHLKLKGFTLRRISKEDLASERSLNSTLFNYHFDNTNPLTILPPTILEIEIHDAFHYAAQKELEFLLTVMRLYSLGSVQCCKFSITTSSLLRHGVSSIPGMNFIGTYDYSLSESLASNFEDFISRMRPHLPNLLERGQIMMPEDIALMRYSDALIEKGSLEARITSAITCLEALYLKGEERSELSNKLGLRIASLLRLLDLNPLEIQSHIQRAYDIRSTYIHGGHVEREKLRDGGDLCLKILEYARLSVVIFLQLKGEAKKDEFINKLDRALLETKSLERVKLQVAELLIPRTPKKV